MKLYVVKVVNGSMSTVSEWSDNAQGAKVSFHDTCKILWNTPEVYDAEVKILNENLDTFEMYQEHIYHERPVEG